MAVIVLNEKMKQFYITWIYIELLMVYYNVVVLAFRCVSIFVSYFVKKK